MRVKRTSGKLTKKFFFSLKTGQFLVSSIFSFVKGGPVIEELVAPKSEREKQWKGIVKRSANNRLCMVYENQNDYEKSCGRPISLPEDDQESTEVDKCFEQWTVHQKLMFLEALSHSLTITIRTICVLSKMPDDERLSLIRWVNEIHHRIPQLAQATRLGEVWRGPDAGLNLAGCYKHHPYLRNLVERQVKLCISRVDSCEGIASVAKGVECGSPESIATTS